MIHTKSLIRRLAYVPWLLAFGLMLGWAGEAQAQITLSLDKSSVREEAGVTKITVTAKTAAALPNATNVILDWGEGTEAAAAATDAPAYPVAATAKTEFGSRKGALTDADPPAAPDNDTFDRYLISLPSLSFAAGAAAAATVTGTITFTPLDDNIIGNTQPADLGATTNPNIRIWIVGTTGTGPAVTGASFLLIDNDQITDQISLSFNPATLSQEAGPTTVTVTATIDGKLVKKALPIPLVVRGEASPGGEALTFTAPTTPADVIEGIRDTDYNLPSLPTVTIPRNRTSGTTTFEIDPKKGPRWIGIGTPATTDLRYDNVNVPDGTDTPDIDESLDGTTDGDDGTATREEQEIEIVPNHLTISTAKVSELKGGDGGTEGLTASPAMIREEVGEKEITLKIVLARAVTKDEKVTFSIPDARGGTRDIHFTASFSDLTIPANETEGTATLTITPFDNTGRIEIDVVAKVGASEQTATFTIVDTDVPSTEITLSPDPANIMEDAGETDVTITATLNGKLLEDDAKLTLVLGNMIPVADPRLGDGATATRDVDYTAIIRSVTIPAGEVSGSTTVSITPMDDGVEDKDETIIIKSTNKPKNEIGDDITVGMATITLKDTGVREDPGAPVDLTPSFTEDDIAASDTVIEGVVGMALEQMLPAAMGDGMLTYSVSTGLPAGLMFDAATRTVSGTPTAAGDAEIVYTVVDGDMGDALPAESAALTYNFEIAAKPDPTTMVASVSVSQSSVRESGESASISVKATLSAPAPVAETIKFTLGAPSEGAQAIRDVDFSATLHGNVAIAEGATEATTSLTLTPIDNGNTDGNRVVGVHATASGGSASADITIADDETASTSISLSADPHTVNENADNTELTITATLDGKVLDADAEVILSIDPNSEATRDVDYRSLFRPVLTIPAGEVSGSTSLLIDPISDMVDEGNETITLHGAIDGLEDGTGLITIADYEMMAPEMAPLAFAEGAMIDAIEATAGTPIDDVILPEATVGSGDDISYSVSELPAGLTFADSTRTLSGTPEAETEGAVEVTYTAMAGEESVSLTFSITVNSMLDFGELGALFGLFDAAGKANPAQDDGEGALQLTVGVPVELTLPEVPGGTGEKTYKMSGLPAGLSFDPATRTISGTPTEEGLAVVILTVTDAVGSTGQVPVPVSVVQPPLDAPDNLVAEDYKGADGLGDQGGFVMLSWDLSEQHDSIDGYRIFRALPVLGNEMIPWAMVDAVPGVAKGYAIVATLDNVSTRWGIAAESGGRTTHGAAKAVFVDAENPYELMAETMMASREAAQADGPVFASLLPEALAYAQGVAPKLNLIGSVISSAVTMTEEAVGATDDIAPLAVPSLSVLDAPNDEGGRIVLTWTLSPSDQLLQGVIVGAIGPAAVESVVGVHGYSIYRSAMGEDEFSLIAQVDAGVASFVDETALNGVHYTYQVRPYDLDNETGSDIEQTAMAVRNSVLDSEGRALFGLFGADNRIGFDDFFIFADNFGLTAEDAGFDPAFDLAPSEAIDFDDFFVFADNFGRSIAAAGKRVPMLAGLNADARMYLDARTAMPNVGEDFVLDVRLADFVAVKGYGLQVQYEADKLAFVEVLTDQPLGGSELATPQVLADQAGVLTVAAHGDLVSDDEVMLSLVFRPTTEIENTVIEITDNQTYDSEFGFNRLALPAPVQLQTRPEVFSLANNYPNPFNPATTIKYALPQAADVELTVYNVLGQPVRTLIAEHQNAGRYVVEWDATNDSGHSLSSGMYFYRLEAGGDLEVKKMLLLK